MHQPLWLSAVVDYTPNSCFAWRKRGPRRAPAKFKSTIRSTTNPSLGYSGLYPRMERPLVTKTMQLELLRSLPENARLKIGVFDRQDLGQEATFQLTGLDSVRKKIGLACKWPADSKQNFIGVAMNQLGGAVGKFV